MNAVIQEIAPEKAPGPDGFIGSFYKASWNVIKGDVLAAVCQRSPEGRRRPRRRRTQERTHTHTTHANWNWMNMRTRSRCAAMRQRFQTLSLNLNRDYKGQQADSLAARS